MAVRHQASRKFLQLSHAVEVDSGTTQLSLLAAYNFWAIPGHDEFKAKTVGKTMATRTDISNDSKGQIDCDKLQDCMNSRV